MVNDKMSEKKLEVKNLGLVQRAIRRYKTDGLHDLTIRVKNNITKNVRESMVFRDYLTPRLDNASVEITNDCNLDCVYCTGAKRRKNGVDIRYIEPRFFRSVIDQLAAMRIGSIQLNFGGESLLHPNFQELLKYTCDARKRGLGFISWFDNGMLFSPDVSRYVVDYSVNRVIFSVDALKAKNEACRKGVSYEVLKENIAALRKIRGENRYPEIWINKIDIESPGDTEKFLQEWGGIVDLVQVSPLQDSLHQTQNKTKYFTQPTINIPYCPYYFFYMGILTDGRIAACCADDDCDTKMGDAKTQSLKQIWVGQRYREMRHQAVHGFKSFPCDQCNFWKTRFKPATSFVLVGGERFEVTYSEHKQYQKIKV